MTERQMTENQLKCIQAYMNSRMELNHGERIKFYQYYFEAPEIESTKDLSMHQANKLITAIKQDPDGLENKIANVLGWQRLV